MSPKKDERGNMLNLKIITLGKLKEKYLKDAEAEYLKRLGPFVKLEIIELKEESFDDKSQPEIIKQKEADKIKKTLGNTKDSYVIALDSHGKQFTSEEFAKQYNNVTMGQWNNVTIIIGGPLGLNKDIINSANLVLSLSKLTFTHQIARIILLEQIYRAMMIIKNRKYHY